MPLYSSNSDIQKSSTSTIDASTIASYPATLFTSNKFIIRVDSAGESQITELLVSHNNAEASSTEYGVVYTSDLLASFQAEYSGGTINIVAYPESSTATNYQVSRELIKG